MKIRLSKFTIQIKNILKGIFNYIFIFLKKSLGKVSAFRKSNPLLSKVLLFSSLTVLILVIVILITNSKNINYTEFVLNQSTQNQSPFVSESVEYNKMIPSKLGINTGISDATFYIYAVGNQFNDELLYNSIVSSQKIGSTNNVKVLVLFSRANNVSESDFADTRLMLITKSEDNLIKSKVISSLGKVDMGNSQTLYDFIRFGMMNFPSRKNILLIDGIGKGQSGIVFDESSNKYLSDSDLEDSLRKVSYSTGTVIDTLILNTSYSANLELFSNVTKYVKYAIAPTSIINLGPLNYGKIIESINKNSNQDSLTISQSIFNENFNSNLVCDSTNEFNLYKIENFKNITNGLETLSTAYFRDETKKIPTTIYNAISSAQKLYDLNEDAFSIYSLDSFYTKIKLFGDEKLINGANQLESDLKSAIVQSSCSDSIKLTVGFPKVSQKVFDKQFEFVDYSSLPSFKQMLINLVSPHSFNEDGIQNISIENNTVSVKYNSNIQSCFSGKVFNDKFLIYSKSLGILKENNLICNSNFASEQSPILSYVSYPLSYPIQDLQMSDIKLDVAFSYKNKSLIGKIFDVEKNIFSVESDGINKFTFNLESENPILVKQFGEFVDKNSQRGYFYSDKIDSAKALSFQSYEDLGFSYKSKRNGEVSLRAYQFSKSNPNFKTTYNLFYALKDLDSVNSNIAKIEFVPTISTQAFDADFSNLDLLKETSQAIDFKYFEFIYSNYSIAPGDNPTIVMNSVNLADDIKYYQGEILGDSNNINFWNNWLKN